MQSSLHLAAIAARLRSLIGGQDAGHLLATAGRLGVSETALRQSTDERSPNPTLDLLAAVVNGYGVDPTWLLYGEYDGATHRTAMENAPVKRSDLVALTARRAMDWDGPLAHLDA